MISIVFFVGCVIPNDDFVEDDHHNDNNNDLLVFKRQIQTPNTPLISFFLMTINDEYYFLRVIIFLIYEKLKATLTIKFKR